MGAGRMGAPKRWVSGSRWGTKMAVGEGAASASCGSGGRAGLVMVLTDTSWHRLCRGVTDLAARGLATGARRRWRVTMLQALRRPWPCFHGATLGFRGTAMEALSLAQALIF